MCVCSDETVVGEDAFVEHASELGVPVTTEAPEIRAFLKRPGRRVVFATYHSSPKVAEASSGRAPEFDLAIADEAHRCAGLASGPFSVILDPSRIRAKKRLFMTATPKYLTQRLIRDGLSSDVELASMDDEGKFGPVFHSLTFSDAIKRGLLSDYQVSVIGVDSEEARQYADEARLVTIDETATDARTLAGQIGLIKAIRNYDLRRVITFHGRVKFARSFSHTLTEVATWMPRRVCPSGTTKASYVSGEMSAGRRNIQLDQLRSLDDCDRRVLSNARCLAEGVNVPSVDGVAFIDPRRSQIDIIQAVGRAIRKSSDKKVGTIVLPVLVDAGSDAEVTLDASVFKPVWDVLKALRAHDNELAEQLDDLRRQLGSRSAPTLRLPTKITIDLPMGLPSGFADAFNVRLVEQTTASWEFWFGLLQRYVEQKGNALVPTGFVLDGYQLGLFVSRQRDKQRHVSPERQRRLESLAGWAWNRDDAVWEGNFNCLQQYVQQNGDAHISQRHVTADGQTIGRWVLTQRTKRALISPERRKRLESLPGWTWNSNEARWELGYALLQKYGEQNGHTRVPTTYVMDGYRLGWWVGNQRNAGDSLSSERVQRLNNIPGWAWNALDAKWEAAYAQLVQHVEQTGTAHLVRRSTKGLGNWVSNQRAHKATLSPERIQRLESLPGWTWAPRDAAWESEYEQLVRRGGVTGYRLSAWDMKQRALYWRGRLQSERVRRLETVPGWSWEARAKRRSDTQTADSPMPRESPISRPAS